MAEVKRKKGESFEALVRRFNRRVQQSGKILQARKIRFRQEEKSYTKKKASALRRKDLREKREFMVKTGRIKDDLERAYRRYR
ncbi:MAG: 30S ribosomal protein S21 [Phycisphaerae bacterium]|nr:30S ribosomal protein S21 [candidate division Zixibacteria bacterium]NIS49504.1 30S ribosomal protein S21 [Phycisphaerae bacterium]NIT72211.1 30S ribosomal protein S21 [candidate division KSB1 bacterium]NIV01271.1 30S ribosomal protein S21 [Phycisphaerae bacterium]NIW96642.1 30S ribosomal protein S21 [Phycisphaerae bacterium]